MKGKRSVGYSFLKKIRAYFRGGARGWAGINDAFVEAIEQFGNKSLRSIICNEAKYVMIKIMKVMKHKGNPDNIIF